MIRSRFLFVLFLAVWAFPSGTYAGTVLGTDGQTVFLTTESAAILRVYGDWIETIGSATCSASGVSVKIKAKLNGAQNNTNPFKGRGRVDLEIRTSGASAGNKTVKLSGGIFGNANVTITVVAAPQVANVSIPSLPEPFSDVTFTISGSGLQNARDPASATIVRDNLVPFVTVGQDVTVQSLRVLNSSGSTLTLRLFLTGKVQDLTIQTDITGSNIKDPLSKEHLKRRVRFRSTNTRNYVRAVNFPFGSTFDVGSTGTLQIELLFPAPGSTTASATPISAGPLPKISSPISISSELRQSLAATAALSSANSTVFFDLVPRDYFESVQGGTPLNPNGLTRVTAAAGDNLIPITFKVKKCGGGQPGTLNTVAIKVWMQNTNTNLPPEYLEKTFKVRCIQ
jgi:hypothetical protein